MTRKLTGKVVIATHNPGKLAEMRELLAPYRIEAVSAGELSLPEPEETGKTFLENARIKAAAAAAAAQLPALADDSGLTVKALGGEPVLEILARVVRGAVAGLDAFEVLPLLLDQALDLGRVALGGLG